MYYFKQTNNSDLALDHHSVNKAKGTELQVIIIIIRINTAKEGTLKKEAYDIFLDRCLS